MSNPSTDLTEDTTNFVLSELGLNEYETRAYLTILEGGVIVAREISDRSSIPYAKVYQVLENLVNKQLIIGDESRPRKFQSRDPKDGLMDRLESIKHDWTKKHTRRKKLVNKVMPELSAIFESSNTNIVKDQGVWTIIGLANILSRLAKLITNTTSFIRISTGNPQLLISKFTKILSELNPRIEVIIRTNGEINELRKIGKVISVSEIGEVTMIIFDKFAQICIMEEQKGKYTASAEYSAVLTQINPIVNSNIIDFDLYNKTEL